MIVVVVGNHCQVDRFDVDPKTGGIVRECPRRPCVKENPLPRMLEMQGQSVLSAQLLVPGRTRVLDERRHLHGNTRAMHLPVRGPP